MVRFLIFGLSLIFVVYGSNFDAIMFFLSLTTLTNDSWTPPYVALLLDAVPKWLKGSASGLYMVRHLVTAAPRIVKRDFCFPFHRPVPFASLTVSPQQAS